MIPGVCAAPHLRGHTNILKRLLIHAGGFNLGLLLRAILGVGTPRGFQDRGGRVVAAVLDLIHIVRELLTVKVVTWCSVSASHHSNCLSSPSPFVATEIVTCATGCGIVRIPPMASHSALMRKSSDARACRHRLAARNDARVHCQRNRLAGSRVLVRRLARMGAARTRRAVQMDILANARGAGGTR